MITGVLTLFLFGKPVLELIEFDSHSNLEMNILFETKGDKLIAKLPFQLPYHSNSEVYKETNEVVMYNGQFYRAESKVFEKDTLYTTFNKESISRQNVMALMSQLSVNYDEDYSSLPLKTINSFLKNISKDYYQIRTAHTIFLWNEYYKLNTKTISTKNFQSPFIGISGPPPKFI